ncbi:MAG: fatty acid desaturase [Thermoanaerobaculia bacterium]|nr:fatty acid desaturase [Thermoanaerobaculia bacterium]
MTETAEFPTGPLPRHVVRPSAAAGFLLVHVAAVLGLLLVGFSWTGVALCVASYYLRMFAITAGFHRYFSHRAYRLSRVPQFLLAFLGQTSAQKGVLWWASNHRHHHKYSDRPEDIHSPVQNGFWWSHIGWILSGLYDETDYSRIPDLAKFPELRWLNRNQYAPTLVYALAVYFAFGWTGLVYGYFLSTVLLWHGTFTINSVMHLFGRRVFPTADQSRNSMIFALVTMGEGWHNNHHYYPSSAAQGFTWWQVDMSFSLLWLGEKIGLVTGLRRAPSPAVREALALARSKLDVSVVTSAQAMDGDPLDQLAARWEGIRDAARVTANYLRSPEALADLETARLRAVQRLDVLQADYAAARTRAEAAASSRLAELGAEIERTRRELHETLLRLVAAAESLGLSAAVSA